MRSAIGQVISYNGISGEPGWLLLLGYPPSLRDALKQGGKVTRPLGKRASSSTACPVFVLGLWVSASSHAGSTQPPHQTHLCCKCTGQQLCPAPGNLSSMGIADTGRELSCHLSCVHGPLGPWAQAKELAVCLGAAQDKEHPFPTQQYYQDAWVCGAPPAIATQHCPCGMWTPNWVPNTDISCNPHSP